MTGLLPSVQSGSRAFRVVNFELYTVGQCVSYLRLYFSRAAIRRPWVVQTPFSWTYTPCAIAFEQEAFFQRVSYCANKSLAPYCESWAIITYTIEICLCESKLTLFRWVNCTMGFIYQHAILIIAMVVTCHILVLAGLRSRMSDAAVRPSVDSVALEAAI